MFPEEKYIQVLVNVVLIVAAFLIVNYLRQIEISSELDKQVQETEDEYNNLFDVLLECNTQPTLIVNNESVVYLSNSSAKRELGLKENVLVKGNYGFISKFINGQNNHYQTEIKINEDDYLVILSKFNTNVLSGAFIIFTKISHIKQVQEQQILFVQNASHELKTPISAIQGICELLLDGKVNQEKKRNEFLEIISKENDRLKHIVSNLTIGNDIKVTYQDFYICDLFSSIEIIFSNYDKTIRNNIVFKTNNEIKLLIKHDEVKIRQVLINLIENAYKYTDTGSITLSAFMDNNRICFSVLDTGIGIEEQEIKSIFKRFYRVDKSRSRLTGGSGLGLNIVKELVDILGGSVEVVSTIDKGTEFRIYLNMIG